MLQDIDEIPLKLGASFLLLCLGCVFENHLWKIIVVLLQMALSSFLDGDSSIIGILISVLTTIGILYLPRFENFSYKKKEGCVMITGCDSGMGKATVEYLAKTNSETNGFEQIFAACFNPKASQEAFEKLLTSDQMKYVTVIPLDVTTDKSCMQAAEVVKKWIKGKQGSKGLCSIIQFHGIAFNGPAAYMPMDMYERQLQVNFFGNLRVIQSFLPLMKERSPDVQGRIVFTGTGGGACSPCPPLLTAYMASKFATEAYCQSLQAELFMTYANIKCCMINPGFVKPTMLMEEGKKLTDKMWKVCEAKQGSSIAKNEFGPLMDHFLKYSALQPGTHVSKVAEAAEHALLATVPRSSYKVGIDSKLAPIVGMMPTGMRETIARHGMYGVLSPAGTVKGYQV